MIVQILVRHGGKGTSRRRSVERFLEGWSMVDDVPVELSELLSLKKIYTAKRTVEQVHLTIVSGIFYGTDIIASLHPIQLKM